MINTINTDNNADDIETANKLYFILYFYNCSTP